MNKKIEERELIYRGTSLEEAADKFIEFLEADGIIPNSQIKTDQNNLYDGCGKKKKGQVGWGTFRSTFGYGGFQNEKSLDGAIGYGGKEINF